MKIQWLPTRKYPERNRTDLKDDTISDRRRKQTSEAV